MWELQAGIGKSRIIATIGLMLMSQLVCNRIHIVIPNAALVRRDSEEFDDYR